MIKFLFSSRILWIPTDGRLLGAIKMGTFTINIHILLYSSINLFILNRFQLRSNPQQVQYLRVGTGGEEKERAGVRGGLQSLRAQDGRPSNHVSIYSINNFPCYNSYLNNKTI